ncbi:MAG: hypothetical protein PHT33_10190 [bacterium]|nr:hypothetical protein [bacterium]
MLSPEGVSSRVKAGRLLKADLLVLLKAVERNGEDGKKLRYVEVVVSETGMGLRPVIGRGILADRSWGIFHYRRFPNSSDQALLL